MSRFTAKVVRRQADPQLFQLCGNVAVFGCTLGLSSNSAHLRFDFINKIRETDQILLNPVQAFQCFRSLLLEPADSGGLLEDQPSICGIGLQDLVHAALFNDAVRGRSRARTDKQFAHVLESGSVPIDEVLGISGLPDPTPD